MTRLHDPSGRQCAPETCGGVSYDPCSYSTEDAKSWTSSVYIVGGAGAGKSTFTAELMRGREAGPIEDLHSLRNKKALVTLRGHQVTGEGLYLGCLREHFPGTDGLDRASSPVGEEWLVKGGAHEYRFIISEGATLATRRFLAALNTYTTALLVHLHVSDEVRAQRFSERGSTQDSRFVANTVTRSRNLMYWAEAEGMRWLSLDTGNPDSWDMGLDLVQDHLERRVS